MRQDGVKRDMVAMAEERLTSPTNFLDLEAFHRASLKSEPFPFVIVPGFVLPAAHARVAADFPKIDRPGSFPSGDLAFGPQFGRFLEELEGPAMRAACAAKFDLDLNGRPSLVTVRGQAGAHDGQIHTDSSWKLITVLIYMNESWEAPGGRLRLLRSAHDLDDVVAEVPPEAGTLLAFRVTDHSWHGHVPTGGARRVVQLNWVTSSAVLWRERLRHGLSARLKRLRS